MTKTASDCSTLSANMAAFDLPVHEGGPAATSLEPTHARGRTSKRPLAPKATKSSRKAANGRSNRGPEAGLSALISAAAAVDGPAPNVGAAWTDAPAAPHPVGGLPKRITDIVVAISALIILSPLLLAVALLIYATMGRPILFAQRRLGFEGRPFACLKFRTMVRDAETTLKSHLANDPKAAREWEIRQKLQKDPRVTALGRVLRRSSIDELPQLVSVLVGDMSCVGPRPVVEAESARYGRNWADYIKARPGLTGAWQVSGRNRLSYRARVALDRQYVRTWSLWRDLWILIKTIPAVLRLDDTA